MKRPADWTAGEHDGGDAASVVQRLDDILDQLNATVQRSAAALERISALKAQL